MKARDADRLGAIRFLSAAIKQREIELRESGKEVSSQSQVCRARARGGGGGGARSCWHPAEPTTPNSIDATMAWVTVTH
jgi:hypothetical protein